MSRYAVLPQQIRAVLSGVVPSEDGDLEYYPCRVTLAGGCVLDTVYNEPELPYLRVWGFIPRTTEARGTSGSRMC
jgi:hypothetical protein